MLHPAPKLQATGEQALCKLSECLIFPTFGKICCLILFNLAAKGPQSNKRKIQGAECFELQPVTSAFSANIGDWSSGGQLRHGSFHEDKLLILLSPFMSARGFFSPMYFQEVVYTHLDGWAGSSSLERSFHIAVFLTVLTDTPEGASGNLCT
uniref:Uncharacterized protein n=1 Tax=Micrurus spixii TaxID=129469 RepID=A0A2D4LCA6_9SAUR